LGFLTAVLIILITFEVSKVVPDEFEFRTYLRRFGASFYHLDDWSPVMPRSFSVVACDTNLGLAESLAATATREAVVVILDISISHSGYFFASSFAAF
jgi:hypothetical protein